MNVPTPDNLQDVEARPFCRRPHPRAIAVPRLAGLPVVCLGVLAAAAAPACANVPATAANVPRLSSLANAKATLYLDFDGDTTPDWGTFNNHPGTTPAYDADGDPTTFSPTEISNMSLAWASVAEKYSPFNLNVTTVAPDALTPYSAFRLVIGGAGDWYGGPAGGVAYVASFNGGSQAQNTGFVFSANLLPNDSGHAGFIADAAAHEAGHSFGLVHQSVWTVNPVTGVPYLAEEYDRGGSGTTAPIMGASYRKRGVWKFGTTNASATSMQDDLGVLSSASNGFGYRDDDHASTALLAETLALSPSGQFAATGVIERTGDVDCFGFLATADGLLSVTLDVAAFGPMLDASLRLYDADGQLLQTFATSSLGEQITALPLTAGRYELGVSGAGGYGDLGTYSLAGQFSAIPEPGILLLVGQTFLSVIVRRPRRAMPWSDGSRGHEEYLPHA